MRLRRAVFGVMLAAGRPMTVAEIVDGLHRAGVRVGEWHAKSERRVLADMLAYQTRAGRVRRTSAATYSFIAPVSRSTRWRYLHWQRWLDDD